jgi:DNA-binding NtrC family response regulator
MEAFQPGFDSDTDTVINVLSVIKPFMPVTPTALLCWIGKTDLEAANGNTKVGLGPIAQAIDAQAFDEVHLISNFQKAETVAFAGWTEARTKVPVTIHHRKLSGPTEFGEIYEAVVSVISAIRDNGKKAIDLTYHLSPGTPAMAAVWILLAKTKLPAQLIESSQAAGVRKVTIPFDIAADFLPDLLRQPDQELERLMQGMSPAAPEFDAIIHRSTIMKRVVAKARRVAHRSVSVLLEGESGTGKELFAKAIHRASSRRERPFKVVNCGAIPSEMVEAELFGYEKGAFTGAAASRPGYFEAANGGTLFLDEIGELPKPAQVKLLRVLQESEVTRLGSTEPRKVDLRIISATNRNLVAEVGTGNFREDLFYRLAVAVIQLPPLRDRSTDLNLIVDSLLSSINSESRSEPGFVEKKLSAGARNLLVRHPWPGNIRELGNTLRRAAVWTSGATISEEDVREALLPANGRDGKSFPSPGRSIEEGIDLTGLLGEIAARYIRDALAVSQGNKTQAAKLLGLSNYQTLNNWMKKYGVRS